MSDRWELRAGDKVLVGDTLVTIDARFAEEMQPGDKLVGVRETGALRRIPAATHRMVDDAVMRAVAAFEALSRARSEDVTRFFESAARLLGDDDVFASVREANEADVRDARARGRSTTRLVLDDKMRRSMIEAFELWSEWQQPAEQLVDSVRHDGWSVEQWRSPLGVVGFVFEGRPNVFADATGVLRTGNTVVFRIGSDALGTAESLMSRVIGPALDAAGMHRDMVQLLSTREHAGGWALFSHEGISLAVARGSGPTVAELGSIARQAGVPVSLHGTGGAWLIVGGECDHSRLRAIVQHSLDRKVCNTLNTVVLQSRNARTMFRLVMEAATTAAAIRGCLPRVHLVDRAMDLIDDNPVIEVHRADGVRQEKQFTPWNPERLGDEFEWEVNPEFMVVVVDSLEEGVDLFNRWSPRFVLSVCSTDDADLEKAWKSSHSPFFGDGFTRWVDGQFALLRPELGLSNWQNGRLLARGGVLSGDSIHTVRLRMQQTDTDLHR